MAGWTQLVVYLGAEDLFARYRAADDAVERSHMQIIWLRGCGKVVSECAVAAGHSARWIAKIVKRDNTEGPEGLGDQRRDNGGWTELLSEAELVEPASVTGVPLPRASS